MNRLKILLLGFGMWAMVGCLEKPAPPENMMSDEKMTSLLIELYELEARLNDGGGTTAEIAPAFYEEQARVFSEYNTDSAQYFASYRYLIDHDFGTYKRIYSVVLDTLEQRKSRINTQLNGR